MIKINIWKIPYGYFRNPNLSFNLESKGYLNLEEFDREEAWHLCNWSCWSKKKPLNLHSEVDVANSDIIFHDPIEKKYHLALPMGWLTENTIEDLVDYCEKYHIKED